MNHTPVTLNEKCRNNLLQLAEYLIRGELKARFSMDQFAEQQYGHTECGTVGCAVGHGPHAGIHKLANESWVEYSYRCFVMDSDAKKNDSNESEVSPWNWCFGASWSEFDNTAVGAARRIVYMLVYGVPDVYESQGVELYKTLIGNNWEFILMQYPELRTGEVVVRECPIKVLPQIR
ncbi:hypothetical protein BWI97_14375 [Siphonobacter sp. BAB-5405]|uniref:hypothetical protein n=1 Tax=Siphonobacter sp. BAB-5405 TaxID=1864825 RepID=UPI000C800C52|nr:hypothetical protein [Siphonobacter sp. BAB-5405]PMD95538.1 hypothetical protein BWI97_14375 [Siphonobacter sp. BAB-5405]